MFNQQTYKESYRSTCLTMEPIKKVHQCMFNQQNYQESTSVHV